MAEKISIIIPVYNVEQYLDRCIRSIIGQAYKNLEIILIDDGSTDHCGKICDDWAGKDNRIRVIHQPNQGLSAARNTGIDIVTGEFLMFVDSDDYIHPAMAEKLYFAIRNEDGEMSICDREIVSSDGTVMNSAPLLSKAQCIDGYSALEVLNHTNGFSVAWNKMYRRFLFSAIRFPVGKINEDTFIMHLLLFQCSKVIILPEKLYFYVQTPGSIMRTEKTVRHLDVVEALYRRYLFYERNGLKRFLPDTAMTVFYWFEDLIRQIRTIRPEEKQRVRKIRRMVRYCFLRHGEKINKWEIVRFECPGLFHFLRKVKRRFIMPIKTHRH